MYKSRFSRNKNKEKSTCAIIIFAKGQRKPPANQLQRINAAAVMKTVHAWETAAEKTAAVTEHRHSL